MCEVKKRLTIVYQGLTHCKTHLVDLWFFLLFQPYVSQFARISSGVSVNVACHEIIQNSITKELKFLVAVGQPEN